MEFSIIVAYCLNRGIGINNRIPWYIPEDLIFFKNKTLKTFNPSNINAVIMGRKTWESLNKKPLKGRINIVVSNTLQKDTKKNILIFSNLTESINFIKNNYQNEVENVFIIGGSELYKEALNNNICNKLYITKIESEYKCDVFFPNIDTENYNQSEYNYYEYNNIKYSRFTLTKIN